MKTTALFLTATLLPALAQGPLLPPAAPAPSMKSLDQIEARIAIPKSPAVPTAGPHFTISAPGSYYLTGNIEIASGNGINIGVSNVTLDLNGFALISTTVTPASGNAIQLTAADLRSIEVKNGHITGGAIRTAGSPATFTSAGWSSSIGNPTGDTGHNCVFSHLTIERCQYGIKLLNPAVLKHITATSNRFSGISANSGSVANCIASLNGEEGIRADGGTITHCVADENGLTGIHAVSGTITHSTAHKNTNTGIYASEGTVSTCTATNNGLYGIYAYSGNVSHSTSHNSGNVGIYGGNVTHCHGRSSNGVGIQAQNASDSAGISTGDIGLKCDGNITNCTGTSNNADGIYCDGNAHNSTGTSTNSTGINCVNASNCTGTSYQWFGLYSRGNATNCTGISADPANAGIRGLQAFGTASYCRARRDGGIALLATIAIGCTVEGSGTVSSSQKHLGTP
jgi:hypothetical protein